MMIKASLLVSFSMMCLLAEPPSTPKGKVYPPPSATS